MVIKDTSDPQGFVDALQAAANYPSQSDTSYTGPCNVQLQSALVQALTASYLRSYVFAFTDSDTQNQLMLGQILERMETTRTQVNVPILHTLNKYTT
jgi:hypothetical protein